MSFWCSLAASGRHMASTLSRAVPMTTSSITAQTARRAVMKTDGLSRVAPGSSFSTPVLLAATSTPDRARIMPDEGGPVADDAAAGRLRMEVWAMCGAPPPISIITTTTVGTASQTAMPPVCLGPRKLIAPMTKMARDGPLLGRRGLLKAEVVKAVQAAQGGGDDEIRQQQQPANGGQPPRMQAGGRIDAAAVGEVLADPDVINARPGRSARRPPAGAAAPRNRPPRPPGR